MIPLKDKLDKINLMKWKRNKVVNPITNRKIKKNGKIYKIIDKKYQKLFPLNFDYLDSQDNKDPISLNKFWIIKNNKKIFVHKNPDEIILYIDDNNNYRSLEKLSLQYLKTYNIRYNPVTFNKIPDDIWNLTTKIVFKDKDIISKAERIFKMFDKISIFLDHKTFLKLNKNELKKFNYEVKEFYYENLTLKNRISIDKKDGLQIFSLTNIILEHKNISYIQNYLLDNIEKLLKINCNLKYMINYILIGALGIVIPEIKNDYPDFNFNF
jgi:hypothetical protein